MRMARLSLAVLWTLALTAGAAGGAAAAADEDIERAGELLQSWRYDEAAELIDKLSRTASARPDVQYLRAELAFLQGDYEASLRILDDLDEGRAQVVDDLRDLVSSTHATTRGFERYETEEGNFELYYPPGKEELLVELAGDALERAYSELGRQFGYRPDEPVRVEILSDPSDLARVSTLTREAIETTGTIALCKYGRLMVVTPRATVFGYPWLDTLVHEYVHYVVNRVSHNNVPIWLHEGLARFEQDRWRAEPDLRLSGVDEHLLAEALDRDALIPFDDMHPSMAKLPSQEAAALAFAEVYTMVSYLHEEMGYEGIRRVLDAQRDGMGAKDAVASALDASWPEVERGWRRYLAGLDLDARAALRGRARADRIRFRRGGPEGGEGDDSAENVGLGEVDSEEARKHTRLGGILRAHGRTEAAAAQYEKALEIVGRDEPYVAGRLSHAYLELERYDEAIELAEPLAGADKNDPTPARALGVAYLAQGEIEAARESFEAAVRVSPFDPDVRCGLADVYEAADDARADRERDACRRLRS